MTHTLLSICAALALAACQGPAAPVDPHQLALAADDIGSVAAEAAMLTEELARGSVPRNFGWVHQEALGQAAVAIADKLAHPVPPAEQARHEQLLLLHARLTAALQRVGFAAGAGQQLDELHARFAQIHAQAAGLGERR